MLQSDNPETQKDGIDIWSKLSGKAFCDQVEGHRISGEQQTAILRHLERISSAGGAGAAGNDPYAIALENEGIPARSATR